ncbi:MAG: SpoIIE family protein phosphatase [Lachnospiraceae bacterium]|nr:SpoIIE family protein phosphatase [Lachnospiraceae bacterium]
MKKSSSTRSRKKKISFIITIWLVVILLVSCVVSALLIRAVFLGRAEAQAELLVKQNVEDVSNDIDELADESLMTFIEEIMADYPTANIDDPEAVSKALQEAFSGHEVEVNIVNSKGIIVASSVPEYVGADMHSGERASEFLILLDESTDNFLQDLRGDSFDESIIMKYAGVRFPDGSGFIEVGLSERIYSYAISHQAQYVATNRRIGQDGYLLISTSDMIITNSYHEEHTGEKVADSGISIDPKKEYHYESMECEIFGVQSYVNINQIQSVYVIGVYPVQETIRNIYILIKTSELLEIVVFAVIFMALIILLHKLIVKNMVKVNNSLTQITEGNLDEKIEIRDTYEFDLLSTDINTTVDKLKDYIAEAATRMDAELEAAKNIQSAALPRVFPPFPERKEFELFATMEAAKEVGGDFYDFYMIGDTLAFLIADVSGKSISGAMFMMKAKEIIRSEAGSGLSPAGIFTSANEALCEGNDTEMFLTAWMGFIDLKTGAVQVANAGHNPPVLIRDGKAEYVKLKPGLMLAGMEGMIYKDQNLQLQKGDILYLYTDGVTEAMNEDEKLYGEGRLLKLLSFKDNYPAPSGDNGVAGAVCELVKKDIKDYVQGAEQSDDITMLCLRFLG